jgi:hypothetical protein
VSIFYAVEDSFGGGKKHPRAVSLLETSLGEPVVSGKVNGIQQKTNEWQSLAAVGSHKAQSGAILLLLPRILK